MLFSNLGSLNKFSIAKAIIAAGNFPSAATIARSADGIDLEILRQVLKKAYLKAKRSRMFSGFNGNFIGIVDGHEICSSSIHKCSCCSARDVSKIEGVVKLNYYHKYSAFILAGEKFSFLLDIEPIYPLEGELTSSRRLLERVCKNYPKAFDVVAGEALFLAGPVFNLLATHNKYAVAVLKDERRYLFEEGLSLSKLSEPIEYDDNGTTYKVWDNTVSGMWDSYKGSVRVIKSEETKTTRTHSDTLGKWNYRTEKADWMWITNLPTVFNLKNTVSICHARWQIENKCFNELANTWNADHIYKHSDNAIQAFILFLFIVLNIFNIFFARNIKNAKIKTKTCLLGLIKAEFLNLNEFSLAPG